MVNAICPSSGKIEMSPDKTTWTDISEWVGRLDPQSRDVPLLTYKTFGGPVVCTGVADPTDIELELLVTEDPDDPYTVLRVAHYAGTRYSLRWGGAGGTMQWEADDAVILSLDDPELNADGDTPLIALLTLSAAQIDWIAAV